MALYVEETPVAIAVRLIAAVALIALAIGIKEQTHYYETELFPWNFA